MASRRSEAEGYLTVWGNKSVVGGIRRFEEELDDRERPSACGEHLGSTGGLVIEANIQVEAMSLLRLAGQIGTLSKGRARPGRGHFFWP